MSLPSTIDDFKSLIGRSRGLAKTNRFMMLMQLPSGFALEMNGVFDNPSSRDIALLCESCSLPGRSISTLDYRILRQSIKIPNGYVNEDITFSFHLTGDYLIKKVFDKWISSIIDIDKYRAHYLDNYTGTVTIQQLDSENKPIYSVELLKAYPISMTAITLDNSADNQTQKLSVTLTYEDYLVKD